MSLHYWFRNPSGTFEEITDRVRLPGPDRDGLDVTTNAEEATVASSEIWVDDPDGDLIIGGLRRVYITEDAVASSSNQVVWNGYTAERTVTRGPFRTTAGRLWKLALVDHNTILERRVLVGAAAKRPAETDVARMQWVESTAAGDLIDDTQYLSTANAVAMDAVDYRGQHVSDVIADCMNQSGKNAFLWLREEVTVDDGPGAISLFYDFPTAAVYNSPIHLTNIASEVNGTTTFAISEDTELHRDPSRVYSGVYLQYDGGAVYEQRGATATAFALGGRDTTALGENVKTLAKATARAQRYLTDFSTEEDVITTTVHRVPRALVNTMMPGMRIRIKATHLPGYETEVYLRILDRNVVETSEEFYSIRMELSTASAAGGGDAPAGSPAHAALYEANGSDGDPGYPPAANFHYSGDAPGPGYVLDPKVGPISYLSSGGKFIGFTINGTGVLDMWFTAEFSAAFGGPVSATWFLYKNGSVIGSVGQSLGSAGFWTAFDEVHVSSVPVSPGDTITAAIVVTGWPDPPDFGGTSHFSHNGLYVSGTLA